MKIVCLFFSLIGFLVISISPGYSEVMEYAIVKGKVKKYDSSTVTIVDKFKQTHLISRKEFQHLKQIENDMFVSIKVKINIKKIKYFDHSLPFDKLTKDQKLAIYKEYLQFALFNESLNKKGTSKKISWVDNVLKSIVSAILPSNAVATSDTLDCVYAGWPAVYHNGVCQAPWSSRSRAAGANYNACGRSDAIRCNPALFGRGAVSINEGHIDSESDTSEGSNSVRVFATDDPSNGICVQASTSSNVTERCLKASRDNYSMDQIVSDMTASTFNSLSTTIASFCNGPQRNSSCNSLETRINDIRVASLPVQKVCQVVSDNGPQTGTECRSVVVKCRQGQEEFQGYLPSEAASTLGGEIKAAGSRVNVEGNLSRNNCGQSGSDLNYSREQCTGLTRVTDLGYNPSEMGEEASGRSSSCMEGRRCIANSNCLATSEGSPDTNLIYEVTMMCDCSTLREERISEAERIQTCAIFNVPQISPVSDTEITPSFRGDGASSAVER